MKKIILILMLLFISVSYGQITKFQAAGYKPLTTIQRNNLIVTVGERWEIFNIDTNRYEYWNGSAWTGTLLDYVETDPLYSGDKSLIKRFDENITLGETVTSSKIIKIGTNGKWVIANNTDSDLGQTSYLITASGGNLDDVIIAYNVMALKGDDNLTYGAPVYIGLNGTVTTAKPVDAFQIGVVAYDADGLWVDTDKYYLINFQKNYLGNNSSGGGDAFLGVTQTFTGFNTFTQTVIIPDATADNHALNRITGDIRYGLINSNNTWTQSQNFIGSGGIQVEDQIILNKAGLAEFTIREFGGKVEMFSSGGTPIEIGVTSTSSVTFGTGSVTAPFLHGGFLFADNDPTNDSHVGDLGYNDLRYLLKTDKQKLNDQFNISANYTTLVTDENKKGIILGGDITLDATLLPAEYDIHFINNSGIAVNISLAAGQNVLNSQTLPDVLEDGFYAYAEVFNSTTWSVIISKIGSGGLNNIVEDLTPQLGGNLGSNGFDINMSSGISSIGYGDIGSPLVSSSFMYFNLNKPTIRGYQSGSSSSYGEIEIDYNTSGGLDMNFIDNANSNNATISYFGLGNGFVVDGIDVWNFNSGRIQGRWQYVTGENTTTSNYNVVLSDVGEIVYFDSATDLIVNISDLTSGLKVGDQLAIVQAGTGIITITTDSYGTVLKKVTTPTTDGIGSIVQVVNYATDKIHIFGDLVNN